MTPEGPIYYTAIFPYRGQLANEPYMNTALILNHALSDQIKCKVEKCDIQSKVITNEFLCITSNQAMQFRFVINEKYKFSS